ncbi:multifunctional CCA tRNA nucleotidyl transferase/2'3'-cyclic phosphodiesterase/2'nucleotidase/phosphatase [Acinetobacter venetianus]|uniref:Multifunctional CCA protein n=1 Tax=Acinetobacter venetianus (strain ATCC 31012 / DSM 23050 / BCRC 14357 / CCUG 45561 / CIP 110063 / KCTC 2702 / LMG 19082 / RAG-1) TaxID=1191460 RepID=N8YLY2_ACIVR|nr:multifunctional CCA addition/repair protein [Acinetobacter venetianus]MDA0695000.1 multifunctional CCA addition/repair protein [Pseudomonadota bacterium]ENV37857.1 multifunctional CCA protein [Acinetobacter venetianus RAG-1 = CIP 110063]KXO82498.1 multifunctional CCA tRNA nucleotidyl transferase/2'3'-cyclic phosphodiesterase/2'nucleotidase/phosphatase [Acinetobacter venetianus]KXO83242.1 multifunctional CCA tRNA nucleotidyl transferase/2'3'-cyclic phosphodiesterase/2'nucleotidase/phosphatase
MQVYLVGGAVRDHLLGHPYHEKDYVVVGATPEQLLAEGYQPVGKDFPVFLHPKTKEEYALARTERKSGVGYHGFQFFTDTTVKLEEDLIRRDLTINAMAMDENGTVYDPYGGQQDLERKILRHVSDAFIEDPLRVLRVARFAARYAAYGFKIADETIQLMKNIAKTGELDALTPERVWKETSRALMEDQADVYFQTLKECDALKILFPEIDALFGVPQRPEYHPEIDCGIHTLMALKEACKANYALEVRFAVLVHDLGKALTPVDELPRHIMHEERGLKPVTDVCDRLKVPTLLKNLALIVCKEHLKCHQAKNLKPGTLWRLLQRLDVLRKPEKVEAFVQACECDARGRLGLETRPYPQAKYILDAMEIVRNIRAQDLPSDIQGAEIGEMLIQYRIEALAKYKEQYGE